MILLSQEISFQMEKMLVATLPFGENNRLPWIYLKGFI
jgi:hypothetical protein